MVLILAGALVSCSRISPPPESTSQGPTPVLPSGPVESYAQVVSRVAPAVVTIRSRRVVQVMEEPVSVDPFFRWLFGRGAAGGATEVLHALGSGVIVESDGRIITNHHVIEGAEDIKVEMSDRRTYSARLIGSDRLSDLAVLKVNANHLPTLALGDSDAVHVGDVCLALGNPLGIGETVTHGIISAKRRRTGLSDGSFQDFLQTDAAINQGNSGGALVNTRGDLVGINSQIVSTTGGFIGIGFAIPSNMAKVVMTQLLAKGKVLRGQLGVSVQDVNSDIAASLGLKDARGTLVSGVTRGGPADRAGVRPGDVILAVNGTPVEDSNALRNRIAMTPPGTDVTLTIFREGRELQLHATLGEFPSDGGLAADRQGGKSSGEPTGQLGIGVQPLTPEIAAHLNLPKSAQGLAVTSVDPRGPAANAGIQPGDVIVSVNRRPVRNAGDLRSALAASGSRAPLFLINRGGQTIFVPVPLQ